MDDPSDAPQPRAGHGRALGATWGNDRKVGLILKHERTGAYDAFFSNCHVVAQGNVDAYKAALADPDAAGHHNVRCQENVVLYHRMVANMIAAPQRHVGANSGKRL